MHLTGPLLGRPPALARCAGEKDRVEAAEKAERDAADKVKQAAAEAKRKEQEAATAVEASKQVWR